MMISTAFRALLTTTLLVALSRSSPVEDLLKNLDTTGSDCLFGDACKSINATATTFNQQTFCCNPGDFISVSSQSGLSLVNAANKCKCHSADSVRQIFQSLPGGKISSLFDNTEMFPKLL